MQELDLQWERHMVARVVVGDDVALGAIVRQYGPLVHGIATRLVGADQADDVSQEVFTALWDHPERWDAERGTLRTFLAMVARRRSIDMLRRTGRRVGNEERAQRSNTMTAPNVDEAAVAMLTGERVREALAGLPDPQRQAIELAYFEGLTFRQVAVRTGASEGTAKSRIRLGLRRLADQLGSFGEVAIG